ncbi:hypothetical protein K438DRAFT_1860649 [Mycena galopus ATCC 62051]|nr:hypothetical protein K438DRAFT_1860649 [Mycena galopus ATCC 62051]
MWPLITRIGQVRLRTLSCRLPIYRKYTPRPPFSIAPASAPAASQTLISCLATPLTAYRRAAQTRPYIVQLSTSLFIWFSGDVLSQSIERSSDPTSSWDIPRTLRALVIGAAAAIPLYHWYNLISKSYTSLPRWWAIAARVSTQQAVFAPLFNAYFFFAQAVLSGSTIAEGAERVRAALPASLLNSLRVWPPVMVVNFAFMPPELRAVLPGFVAVGWQCYLCVLNQRTAQLLEEKGREAKV